MVGIFRSSTLFAESFSSKLVREMIYGVRRRSLQVTERGHSPEELHRGRKRSTGEQGSVSGVVR